jgi:hypothetical protein
VDKKETWITVLVEELDGGDGGALVGEHCGELAMPQLVVHQ